MGAKVINEKNKLQRHISIYTRRMKSYREADKVRCRYRIEEFRTQLAEIERIEDIIKTTLKVVDDYYSVRIRPLIGVKMATIKQRDSVERIARNMFFIITVEMGISARSLSSYFWAKNILPYTMEKARVRAMESTPNKLMSKDMLEIKEEIKLELSKRKIK